MQLESLESRRLMSVSLNPSTHVLTILGTANDDTITAKVVAGTLQVFDNGVPHNFAVGSVSQIYADAKAGDDDLTLEASVHIPSRLYSGPGGFSATQGDRIQGGSGLDRIYLQSDLSGGNGGAGNDWIYVTGGTSGAGGGEGNDTIVTQIPGGSHDNTYDGGPGIDTVDYSSSTVGVLLRNGVSGVYFPGTQTVDGSQSDLISTMENFTGGAGNDYLFGDDGVNNILSGRGGNDKLSGKGGNDYLDGGPGHDSAFGGTGNDIIKLKDGESDYFEGGADFDTAIVDAILDTQNGTTESVST